MKTIISIILLGLILTGCGSDTPFQRGARAIKGGLSGDSDSKPDDGSSPDEGSGDNKPTPTLDRDFFNTNLLPSLDAKCNKCHDNYASTFEEAITLVIPGHADRSPLYLAATGTGHKTIWKTDSAEAATLATWINGAKL